MKNSNNIFMGVILIVLGGLALGLINDWFSFDISMREIARFWPILIILAGIAVMLDSRRSLLNSTSVLLVALAIPFGVYNCTSNTLKKVEDKMHGKGFDFDVDVNDDDFTYDEGTDSTSEANHQTYKVDKVEGVKSAELKIGGGAARFLLEQAEPGQLFAADTRLAGVSGFTLREEASGSHQKVVFKMKSQKNIRLNDKGLDRKVTLKLNTEPVWDINMEIGAGDLKYDLTPYKVEKITLETGASNIDLKLGDLLSQSNVKIESGVANIEIAVPENVGCEIKMDGALNAKNFTGFTKIKSGLYRTEGFDSAAKKIYIDTDSGMSNFTVRRY
ncbi:DUF5668 domain-containing protein [Leadbetterella sp. DM7]|uniref:LiaI-LiaF-like domain-containing protein n=1 Tax=Leadbetterella sp. DM7 TaxID=3235085 RepID=UPI00349E9C35